MNTSFPAVSRFHHVSLSVADLEAAERWYQQAAAVQAGARFAYVMDPEGNLLELIQPPQR